MEVDFYEKPGCVNNTKQKKMLEEKGHLVKSFDILKYPWTVEELKPFLQTRPLADWFNLSAPSIKNGDVKTENYTEDSALEAMLHDPFLIKRPLLKVGDKYGCGFDSELAQDLIFGEDVTHLLKCPKSKSKPSCD